jgi:hypothetical protein
MTTIDRATAADLVTLATDVGPAPLQVGAVLRLAPSSTGRTDPADLVAALEQRSRAIPRLRQRLLRTPPGCGRPVWVDDADFTIGRHVEVARCPGPGDERALLDLAAEVVAVPLLRDRPLWRMVVVTDLVDGWPATDGSERPAAGAGTPPHPRALLADALRSRVDAVRNSPAALRRARAAVNLLRAGGRRPPERTTLNRPTGGRRRFDVVRADLARVRDEAHRLGGTVNDVVLVAVAQAVAHVLDGRGEGLDRLVCSIPVAARTETTATELGNRVGAVPVEVPTTGRWDDRVAATAAATRRAKAGWRGATDAVMGPVFRALAAARVFRRFVERQTLVHTFVTNLRGPDEPLRLLGAGVRSIDAVAVVPGNVTVSFTVLSYAGVLAVTIVSDPETFSETDALAGALADALGGTIRTAPAGR